MADSFVIRQEASPPGLCSCFSKLFCCERLHRHQWIKENTLNPFTLEKEVAQGLISLCKFSFSHLRTDNEILVKIFISTLPDDEILVKIPISTVADDKILVIRSTYIYRSKANFTGLKHRARKNLAAHI